MTDGDDDASDRSRPAEESEPTGDEVDGAGDDTVDAEAEGAAEADADADAEAEGADEAVEAVGVTAEELDARLDEAAADLEAAETEADLDAVEAELDGVEADLEAAELPDPDEDEDEAEEDAESPREELESRLSELRESLEEQRGPYAEDAVERIEEAATTVEETRWTVSGESDVDAAVRSFAERVGEILGAEFAAQSRDRDRADGEPAADGDRAGATDDPGADGGDGDGADAAALAATLRDVAEEIEARSLHPDEDRDTVADLLEAVEGLESDIEGAEGWDDLETREKLAAEGYYDVIGHYKDFPPELAALKEHERRGNVEMVLLALDRLGSEFMETHCMEALVRMNDPAAFDEMHRRAQKRDRSAIEAIGHMGPDAADAVETLIEYVDADGNLKLQKATFIALGEIGDERAAQPLANKLAAEADAVRSAAARALGLLGDTRTTDPLTDVLADDDSDEVRASAAWALRQIGTETALEAAAEVADERSYIVQVEGERAQAALDREDAASPTA